MKVSEGGDDMTATMTTLEEWQDQYAKLAARVEEAVVQYTGRIAETAAEYVPERPDWAPFDRVPTMTEFIDNQLKFRQRVVDDHAAFVRSLIKAMHPALAKLEAKAPPSKAAKPAPRRRSAVRTA
jgi:hypothetical protein